MARKAWEMRRKTLGDEHSATIADAVAWAGLLDGLGRFGESIPIYRRAITVYEDRLGPHHFEVAATLNNLGMALAAEGHTGEARRLLSRAVHIKSTLFAPGHPEVRLAEANLASLDEQAVW